MAPRTTVVITMLQVIYQGVPGVGRGQTMLIVCNVIQIVAI